MLQRLNQKPQISMSIETKMKVVLRSSNHKNFIVHFAVLRSIIHELDALPDAANVTNVVTLDISRKHVILVKLQRSHQLHYMITTFRLHFQGKQIPKYLIP